MTHQTKTFAITDPRTFDGDCYEVAERAVAQLQGLLVLAEQAAGPTLLMVRNAELERQLAAGGEADVAAFEASAQGRRWKSLATNLEAARRELEVLKRVAAHNPKATIR